MLLHTRTSSRRHLRTASTGSEIVVKQAREVVVEPERRVGAESCHSQGAFAAASPQGNAWSIGVWPTYAGGMGEAR